MAVHRNCDGKKSFRNDGRQSEDEINMAVVGFGRRAPPSISRGTISSEISTQDAS